MKSERGPIELRWIAAATLASVMAGHVLLETGVDALFLANISVERLPLVTIGIAFIALAVSRLGDGQGHRRQLGALQIVATLGTLVLWLLVDRAGSWVFYLLYLWSGLITSLVVVRFWLLLGDLFTIAEGKKAFASIAMGGSIGALAGSMGAAAAAPHVGGRGLLILAASAYAVSALGPLLSMSTGVGSAGPHLRDLDSPKGFRDSLEALLGNPYACRIAALVMVGGITLTLGDFLFKSVLTEEVARESLAVWLSRIYLGLNVLSIAVLAFGTTPIVRRLGVDRSIVVLPSLIGLAAIGSLLGGALGATIFLKLADGTLRYSLHKTATELLYLPMSSSLRLSVKTAIDLVGQSGAKALASLLVLGLVLIPESRTVIAAGVAISAGVWILLGLRLRHWYLNVFRDTLGEGTIQTVLDHPELDLESAGSLIRALSDPDEQRAMAAMRLLSERGQCDLVPSLVLYHPSPRVVVEALDLFAVSGREDLRHLLDHLVEHDDARVRAAAVRAKWVLDRDADDLRIHLDSHCLVVRVSAAAGVLSLHEMTDEQYVDVLAEALDDESPDARLAAAFAARLEYRPVYRQALVQMARDADPEVASEALDAIRASGDEYFIAPLVDLLDRRGLREGVRRALIEKGERALDELAARLGSERTPVSIQSHIPRTIARFDDPSAARLLLDGFARVESGLVRFKLLRGLETLLLSRRERGVLRASHLAAVDLLPLQVEFDRTLERSTRLLALERSFLREHRRERKHSTVAGELLVDLMRDKRSLAVGRLFMMLGLLHPKEDFRLIRSGLLGEDATDRASAQELVETLLEHDVATALLDLVGIGEVPRPHEAAADSPDDQADPSDQADLAHHHDSEFSDYVGLLARVLEDESQTLRAVALYHAGELGLDADEVLRAASSMEMTEEGGLGSIGVRAKEVGLAAVRELLDRRSNPKSATAS